MPLWDSPHGRLGILFSGGHGVPSLASPEEAEPRIV